MLERINKSSDIRALSEPELKTLSEEIRQFLLEKVSKSGGHLGSNLGAVELTLALHLCMEFPKDKLIFDVGHQCYTHKILTGRRDRFDSLRQEGGLSGFPKRDESDCDVWNSGHASNSISAALGMAYARDLKKSDEKIAVVIGDGALTGGQVYEALNNAAKLTTPLLIVLNDNEMSISKNVGGMSDNLEHLRTSKRYTAAKAKTKAGLAKLPGGNALIRFIQKLKHLFKSLRITNMVFEDLGITYLGPVDGHDITAMKARFREAFNYPGPVIVHVITKKGKGYLPSETNPAMFHGVGAFDIKSGLPVSNHELTWTDVFGRSLVESAAKDERICAITAAMTSGTGLCDFAQKYKDRFFDVGIAEEHAVTFAAGLAAGGMVPVVAIYSSFLQRAYDQILEDVCLQKLHVIFAIDRAGFVSGDGDTHQGVYDIDYLRSMPGIVELAPSNEAELIAMFSWALNYDGPVAIRYPRGKVSTTDYSECGKVSTIEYKKCEVLKRVPDELKKDAYACVGLGAGMEKAYESYRSHLAKNENAALINARFVDFDGFNELSNDYLRVEYYVDRV